MWSQDRRLGLVCCLAFLVPAVCIANLGVAHTIFTLDLMFYYRKLIHMTFTRYSKIIG